MFNTLVLFRFSATIAEEFVTKYEFFNFNFITIDLSVHLCQRSFCKKIIYMHEVLQAMGLYFGHKITSNVCLTTQ